MDNEMHVEHFPKPKAVEDLPPRIDPDDVDEMMEPTWSESARGTFRVVLEEQPEMNGADLAALYQVAELETLADQMTEVARAAGFMAKGVAGQDVSHPGVTEARLSRTAAAQILNRIRKEPNGMQGHQRKAARARWGVRG